MEDMIKNSYNQVISPAMALWNQRITLEKNKEHLLKLIDAVGCQNDLAAYQWAQLLAITLDFKPDLILELGRLSGNSTCMFTEAANLLGAQNCSVISLCLTDDFQKKTLPKVLRVVSEEWLKPLQALKCDILFFNYEKALKDYNRILVFWDAHGYEVAECVLGKILPLIADRPHLVIMHDLSDARYSSGKEYGGKQLWKRNHYPEGSRMRLGHIDSAVEQAVAIVDFASRNEIALESADHSQQTYFSGNPDKLAEMKQLLGKEFFSLSAHWFWFTLNERPGPYTFPKFVPPVEIHRTFLQRFRKAIGILLGRDTF